MKASYRDLVVWRKSLSVAELVYVATGRFPREEVFGLASQMRRASVSVPSNIAEGRQRKNVREFLQFLRIALGSTAELHTQSLLAEKIYPESGVGVITTPLEEVRKMLFSLIHKLETVNRKL